MEQDSSSTGATDKVRTGAIGTLVAGYALFDVIPIAVIVVGLTAWFERPQILFVITAVALIVINVACCRWLQGHWDGWIAGDGKRVEAKLEQMRESRVMKHPVAWITRGSDWWFALATAIVNPIIVVAAARIVRWSVDHRAADHDCVRRVRRSDGGSLHSHRYALGEALRAA